MKFTTIVSITTVIGIGIMLGVNMLLGFCFMIGTLPISMALSDDMNDYDSSYGSSSSKPYYKNEFEEYQHYKHVKRSMKK